MGLTRASNVRAKKGFNCAKLILNLFRVILNFDIRHESARVAHDLQQPAAKTIFGAASDGEKGFSLGRGSF